MSAMIATILAAADHFAVLGLPVASVDAKTVRSAYRAAALLVHPDKNPENHENAKQAFVVLSTAFECLSDEEKQTIYLEKLTQKRATAGPNARFKPKTSAKKAGRTTAAKPAGEKWYNKPWSEIEKEIQRQEEEFARQQAEDRKQYQESKKRKTAERAKRNERIKQGLSALAEKYGLSEELPSLVGQQQHTAADTNGHAQSAGAGQMVERKQTQPQPHKQRFPTRTEQARQQQEELARGFDNGNSDTAAAAAHTQAHTLAEAVKTHVPSVCYLCSRQFPNAEQLIRHEQLSELHKRNQERVRAEQLLAELNSAIETDHSVPVSAPAPASVPPSVSVNFYAQSVASEHTPAATNGRHSPPPLPAATTAATAAVSASVSVSHPHAHGQPHIQTQAQPQTQSRKRGRSFSETAAPRPMAMDAEADNDSDSGRDRDSDTEDEHTRARSHTHASRGAGSDADRWERGRSLSPAASGNGVAERERDTVREDRDRDARPYPSSMASSRADCCYHGSASGYCSDDDESLRYTRARSYANADTDTDRDRDTGADADGRSAKRPKFPHYVYPDTETVADTAKDRDREKDREADAHIKSSRTRLPPASVSLAGGISFVKSTAPAAVIE